MTLSNAPHLEQRTDYGGGARPTSNANIAGLLGSLDGPHTIFENVDDRRAITNCFHYFDT